MSFKSGSKSDRISDEKIEQASKLYKSFHEKAPGPGKLLTIEMRGRREILEVGQFFGIIYIAEGQKYLHKFNKRNRPLVFVSSDGRQIYILKGGYKFTDRGFIG